MATNIHVNRSTQPCMTVADLMPARVRAIVVDDSPEMVRTVTELLELCGDLEVVATAIDGLDAISAVRIYDPHLVIMDVNMPRMNGLCATLHIRELTSQTKILIMSSEDGPEMKCAARECGADGFISKSSLINQCRFQLNRLFPSRNSACLLQAEPGQEA